MQNTELLENALQDMRAFFQKEQSLWDTGDIAEYMKLGKKTVQNGINKWDGFPAARVLPTGGKRWEPKEVKAWVARRRG